MIYFYIGILFLLISLCAFMVILYKIFTLIQSGEPQGKFLFVSLLLSSVGLISSFAFLVTFKPIPPVDNDRYSRVCGTVLKMWQEKSGGGGDFLHTDPVETNWVVGYRVDGEVKSAYLSRSEYASIKEGDIITITHEKTNFVHGYNGLPVWVDVVKPGCDSTSDGKK